MDIWHIRWTCPVWILCPKNHHPFVNECHTACCELSRILFVVELVEYKEYPLQAGPLEFEYLDSNTVQLLLCMMNNCFTTGTYVIIDSGFYVLKVLIQLINKGLFDCAITKRRRYWTSMVPGKDTEDRFEEVEVGETDAIQGTVDDIIYNL